MTASVESVLESVFGNTAQHIYSQSLPTILNEFGTAVVGSFGYVIGGNNQFFGGGALNTVYVTSLGLPDTDGPVTSSLVVTPNPVVVNMPISLSAVVDDSNSGNSIVASARYRVDGGAWIAMGAQDSDFNSVLENVTADIGPFSTADAKEICVQGTDAAGNTGPESCILLAIYDPTGGFVTGGGWINSTAGAYRADLTLTGKANFGFVSKYQKGANIPTGNTEFQFKTGNLNFSSTAYDWLVIAGARAQYKGTGTINGGNDNGSGYAFMLTAIDGQVNGGGGVDKFRIKIWKKSDGTIVYDNQVGSGVDGSDTSDPVTAVGGGSIVIHKN